MELSLFLAKVIGLYLIIIGIAVIWRRSFFPLVVAIYFDNQALVLLGGVMTLILGLLIVVSHSVFEMNWRFLITLLGYLTLFKAIVHLYAPKHARRMAERMVVGEAYRLAAGVFVIVGVYLTYLGFAG